MEVISLEKSGWILQQNRTVTPPKWFRGNAIAAKYGKSFTPVFQYGFESANRRMTVVCSAEGSRQLRYFLLSFFPSFLLSIIHS